MNFTEKKLLDCTVNIPKILILDNVDDHILWPSFPYTDSYLNEALIEPLNTGYLMCSKDYIPDFSIKDEKSFRNKTNRLIKNTKRSLRSGFLSEHEGFVLTRRIYKSGIERFGLLALLDYEQYDLSATSLIKISKKPDEKTVNKYTEYLEKAILDFPYTTALFDDLARTLIEPLAASNFHFTPIFSFDHPVFGLYEGYLINTPQHYTLISNSLTKIKKQMLEECKPLFIVNEGVESFESGARHWQQLKEKYGNDLYQLHPARFQLVELFNIHDPITKILPFNILLRNTKSDELISKIRDFEKIKVETQSSPSELFDTILKRFNKYGSLCYGIIHENVSSLVTFRQPLTNFGIVNIEEILNDYLTKRKEDIVFYRNTTELINDLKQDSDTAVIMPPFNKTTFFADISKSGALNKYSYYSDEPINQRFLFESRMIIDD